MSPVLCTEERQEDSPMATNVVAPRKESHGDAWATTPLSTASARAVRLCGRRSGLLVLRQRGWTADDTGGTVPQLDASAKRTVTIP